MLDWTFQDRAIDDIKYQLSRGLKRVMLMVPTGGGKTHIAVKIITMALKKDKKVLFVVDRKTLVNQTSDTFYKNHIDHGIVQGDNPNYAPWKGVQICSIQSLMRRKTPDADLVLVDEAHTHYKHMTEIMKMWSLVPFIGLSATPFTRGLGKHYQTLINPVNTSQLIEMGNLVKSIIYAPPTIDVKGIKLVAGEYSSKEVAEKVKGTRITADIIDTWLDKGEGRKTIIFPANVAHSKDLVNAFNEAGTPAEHVDAHTPDEDRDDIFRRFKEGETMILSSVGVLTKGFDETSVSCIVLAKPTKSLMLYIQMVGRGLRAHDGKEDCIILDHATNVERLGWPDDPLPDYLCDGSETENARTDTNEEKKEKELKPKKCPECNHLVEAKIFTCPVCGHLFARPTNVEVEDGELVKVKRSPADIRHKESTREQKQEMWTAFLELGKSRGHSSHLYKDYYGVWPRKLDDEAYACSHDNMDAARSFITAKNIRYAKSR